MKINDYLEFRFGLKVRSEYNRLAFKEILENPEKYPHLAMYKSELEDGMFDKNYELSGCVDDDPEGEMSVQEGQQLLCAMLAAFGKSVNPNDVKLKCIESGYLFYPNQSINYATDQFNRYILKEDLLRLGYGKINKMTSQHYNEWHASFNEDVYITSEDDNDYLIKNKEAILKHSFPDSFALHFENESMPKEKLFDNVEGYGMVYYKFVFKHRNGATSVLPLYVTEAGFDPYHWIHNDLMDIYKNKKER